MIDLAAEPKSDNELCKLVVDADSEEEGRLEAVDTENDPDSWSESNWSI